MKDRLEKFAGGMILMLPVTALACIPLMLLGSWVEDMTGAIWLAVIFEFMGGCMGVINLE